MTINADLVSETSVFSVAAKSPMRSPKLAVLVMRIGLSSLVEGCARSNGRVLAGLSMLASCTLLAARIELRSSLDTAEG